MKALFQSKLNILATHCCVCFRPLTDALSVESGIGPICRKNYFPDTSITEDQFLKLRGVLYSLEDDYPTMELLTQVIEEDWKSGTRKTANIIIYWASIHYQNKEIVFYCSKLLKVLGLDMLASKLEHDRISVYIKKEEDHIELGVEPRLLKHYHHSELKAKGGFYSYALTKVSKKDVYVFKDANDPKIKELENYIGHHFHKNMALIGQGFFSESTDVIKPIPQRTLVVTTSFPSKNQTNINQKGVGLCHNTTNPSWLEVSTPYNFNFIQDLKLLPKEDRKWDSNVWVVNAKHKTTVLGLLSQYFNYNAPIL